MPKVSKPPDSGGLFVAQRFHRLQSRGAVGRVEAKEQADRGGKQGRQQNGIQADLRDERGSAGCRHAPDDESDQVTQAYADQAAKQAEQRRFGQELDEDVAPPGADGFAQADFTGAR